MKTLLLSDMHSYTDERILHYASEADEAWHCGDFGNVAVIQALEAVKPLHGVYGNIDGTEVRGYFPEVSRFRCEGVEALMTHIGDYPNRCTPLAKREIQKHPPRLLISGHSHILKVQYDLQYQLLRLNPGVAGIYDWQKVRTMLRFELEAGEIKNLEIIELAER